MGGLLMIAGSIGVICAAGSGIAASLKFFNTWEPDFSKKGKKSNNSKLQRGGMNNDKIESLSRRANTRSEL